MSLNPNAVPFHAYSAILYSPPPFQQFHAYPPFSPKVIINPYHVSSNFIFPNITCYTIPIFYPYYFYHQKPPHSGSVILTELNDETSCEELSKIDENPTICEKNGNFNHGVVKKWLSANERTFFDDKEFEFKEEHGYNDTRTTVMIKNIPTKFDKKKMLEIIDDHCLRINQNVKAYGGCANHVMSEFDFFYLPIDFKTQNNLGYAFVNFTSAVAAWRLHCEMHRKDWLPAHSSKVCEITYARIQGLNNLVWHFNRSVFCCDSIDYLPVLFKPSRNGYHASKTCETYIGKHIPNYSRRRFRVSGIANHKYIVKCLHKKNGKVESK